MVLSHEAETNNLMVNFLPFLSTSHIIPMVDMARVFSMQAVDVTVITTTGNPSIFQMSIDRDFNRGRSI